MRKWYKWSDEEKLYLKEITPGRHYKEIQELMYEKFNHQFSMPQIKSAISRYNLNTGFTGRFEKGHVPVNKGTKGMMKANKTSFKKGQIPKNVRPVGSERVNVEGYTEIKVSEPNKWRLKHRVLYEEYHNVKLNSNESIIFMDGDRSNMSKENLTLVTRQELLKLNKLNLMSSNAELTETGLNVAKLIIKINDCNRSVNDAK